MDFSASGRSADCFHFCNRGHMGNTRMAGFLGHGKFPLHNSRESIYTYSLNYSRNSLGVIIMIFYFFFYSPIHRNVFRSHRNHILQLLGSFNQCRATQSIWAVKRRFPPV
jgi:hypothetical protein